MSRTLALSCALLMSVLALAPASAAEPTLEIVRKRGELICGVNGELPGFSAANDAKQWEGIDVDYCRAVAAATLGDATKVKFVPLTTKTWFSALIAGEVDMLARNATWTLERSAGGKIRFTTVNFFDGQGFVVPKERNIDKAAQLGGHTVCVTKGTTTAANLMAWASLMNITITPVLVDDENAMFDAFLNNKCVAITKDATALASAIVRRGLAPLFKMLPDVISKEPLGPYVRAGDDAWLDIIRWTQYAMVTAEERNIRSTTVENRRKDALDVNVRRLLGVDPGIGKPLGLDDSWVFNVVKQVGNYSEVYDRNVGMGSPLKFSRGINSLPKEVGLMYAPPM